MEKYIVETNTFAWWMPNTIRNKNIIISKVKSRYWVITYTFGIRITKDAEEYLRFDKYNRNHLWWGAIWKETKNVRDGGVYEITPGYKEINLHLFFDINIGEKFRRKTRMVSGGHKADVPSILTYLSAVSNDYVCIAFNNISFKWA